MNSQESKRNRLLLPKAGQMYQLALSLQGSGKSVFLGVERKGDVNTNENKSREGG